MEVFRMATIYEISSKYKFIQQLIEDGSPQEAFAEALQAIDGEAAEKLEAYAMVLKNIQSDVDGLDAEIKRLQERKKSMVNKIDNMKQAMSDALELVEPDKDGKKRLKTSKFSFYFTERSSVTVNDVSVLPSTMIEVIEERKPKMDEIKQAIEEGKKIDGVSITKNKSLGIR